MGGGRRKNFVFYASQPCQTYQGGERQTETDRIGRRREKTIIAIAIIINIIVIIVTSFVPVVVEI